MLKHVPWTAAQPPQPKLINQQIQKEGYGVFAFPLACQQTSIQSTTLDNEVIWLARGEARVTTTAGQSLDLKPGDRINLVKGVSYTVSTTTPTGAFYMVGKRVVANVS